MRSFSVLCKETQVAGMQVAGMKLASTVSDGLRVQQTAARLQYKTKSVKLESALKINKSTKSIPTVRGALSNRLPAYLYSKWAYWGLLSDAGEATPAPGPFVTRKQSLFNGRPRWFCKVLEQIFYEGTPVCSCVMHSMD